MRLQKNEKFSEREKRIIDCLLSDYSVKDIGEEFSIPYNHAAVAISDIRKKLSAPPHIRLTRDEWIYYILQEHIDCTVFIDITTARVVPRKGSNLLP